MAADAASQADPTKSRGRTGCEEARARRDEAKALLRQGVDPAAHKRRVKAAQAEALANTFGTLADEFLKLGQL